jgi:arylsulfatase A-like enzyme
MTVLARRTASGWALGLWAGLLGGALAGMAEGVMAWNASAQYLPGAGGRLQLLVFLCALESLFGAILASLAGGLIAFLWFGSDLGLVAGGVWRRGGTSLFAWALATLFGLGAAVVAISQLTLYAELHFHNRALISKWVGALSVAVALGLVVAAFPLQRLLRALAVQVRWTASRWATAGALGLTLALALAAAAIANHETVQVLDLRPLVSGLAFAVGAIGSAIVVKRPPFRSARARRAAHVGLIASTLLVTILAGATDGVRKAAALHTAFGGPLTTTLRSVFDFDRDGYSSILGGGDCNDFDPDVHPGAFDWPDNGKDENCSGADATLKTDPPAPFVELPAGAPKDANILLVTIDTLRADHLGAYGYGRPTSPNLDALANRSVVFEHAYAHAPSTRYSMPVILTGRYASQVAWDSACPFTGGCATRWPPPLAQSNRTIAEILKDAGYYTAALLNYRFFERGGGYDQGFDLYDNGRAHLHQGPSDPATHGSSSREQADVTIDFLRSHTEGKWFLWVHFYDPHYYYEVHPEVPSFGSSEMDRYDGEIRFTDLHVGRILEALDELHLADHTIVVVTGDHGEGFGEHGPATQHHGYHLYNAQTQVPIIIHAPGIPARRALEPVGHVDLLPTLLNLVGAPGEPQLVGRTAVDLMLGRETPRHLYQEVMYEGPVTRKTIVNRDWKLIWNMVPDNSYELYQVATDPGEQHDRYGESGTRDLAAGMRRDLAAWVERTALPPGFAEKVAGAVGDRPPEGAHPVGALLGGALELVGYQLASPTVAPGGAIDITCVWRARKHVGGGWRPFVHIEGDGGVWINADHVPVDGFWPVDRWRPGQYVRDHQIIPVPSVARGQLSIWVGMFEGGKRMSVSGAATDPRGRLRLAQVEVR